jgi:hypothetical protein
MGKQKFLTVIPNKRSTCCAPILNPARLRKHRKLTIQKKTDAPAREIYLDSWSHDDAFASRCPERQRFFKGAVSVKTVVCRRDNP